MISPQRRKSRIFSHFRRAWVAGISLVLFAAAGISLLLERDRARELVEKRVDWWTLTFFMMLFASVGTLKYVGAAEIVAKSLTSWVGGNPKNLFVVLTRAIGILTGFMDNVLAVATFIPIIQDIAKTGIDVTPYWWGILFGGTLFGNLTMIGSTANIVAIGIIERQKIGHITFGQWVKPGTIVSISTLAIATLLIYLQFYV